MGTLYDGGELFPEWLRRDIELAERDTILREYLQFMTAEDIEVDESLERLLAEPKEPPQADIIPYPTNLIFFRPYVEKRCFS